MCDTQMILKLEEHASVRLPSVLGYTTVCVRVCVWEGGGGL